MIDGEGAIWSRWPKRTNVVVEIRMTHKETIERVQELFPGRFALAHMSAGSLGKKEQWLWSLDTKSSRDLLTRLLPFFVTKKEAALAAIELCHRPVDRDRMDRANAILRGLNGRSGPSMFLVDLPRVGTVSGVVTRL